MIRKLVIRLLLGFAALLLIAVLSAGIAVFLAFRPPAFYVDLRAQQFSPDDQRVAQTLLERSEADLNSWQRRSIALQYRQLTITPAAVRGAPASEYDPRRDVHSITFTAQQLNALLASGEAAASGSYQNPRVQIQQDGIWFACEVVTSHADCVLSVELKPTLSPEGCLCVDFVSARIGQLPLPLKTALRFIPRDLHRLGHNMDLDLTAPTPRINLNITDDDPHAPSIHGIQCQEGAVTIEFLAPVLKRQQGDRDAIPLVVSDPEWQRAQPLQVETQRAQSSRESS